MYKLKNENSVLGYKGKSYTNENLNKLPKDFLEYLEKNGAIIKDKKKKDKEPSE